MASKSNVLHLDKKQPVDINEGNKVLAYFMGDFSTELFKDNAHYYGQYNFEESWDSIMKVVKKIKEIVYCGGYKILSIEHSLYIKVCNTLYDCDLKGAWLACVRWCFFYFQHSKHTQRITSEETEFAVSKKAIRDFQDKCVFLPEKEVIQILTTEKMKSIYRLVGDGRIPLKGHQDTIVVVRENVIERIFTSEELDSDDSK